MKEQLTMDLKHPTIIDERLDEQPCEGIEDRNGNNLSCRVRRTRWADSTVWQVTCDTCRGHIRWEDVE